MHGYLREVLDHLLTSFFNKKWFSSIGSTDVHSTQSNQIIYIYIYIYIYTMILKCIKCIFTDLYIKNYLLNTYNDRLWFHYLIIIIYSFESFSHQRYLMVSYWSLSDSKSPQVSRNLLNMVADLNNAVVWMVLMVLYFPKSSSLFTNPRGLFRALQLQLVSPLPSCSIVSLVV